MNAERPDDHASAPQHRSDRYDLWFDGLLSPEEAEAVRREIAADPRLSARYEADAAIEASLRQSLGAGRPVRLRPAVRNLAEPRPQRRVAAAAAMLALGGLGWVATRGAADSRPPADRSAPTTELAGRYRPLPASCELGNVFLDALAVEFQPVVGCRVRDDWNERLLAQLASAPCNRDESVVVLGEWLDPRLEADNVVMLRRGDDPIMLVVPDCANETDLCVPKDSGLFVHRGLRDGRPIYEVSPLPGSEVLACVDAQNVVTQQY